MFYAIMTYLNENKSRQLLRSLGASYKQVFPYKYKIAEKFIRLCEKSGCDF